MREAKAVLLHYLHGKFVAALPDFDFLPLAIWQRFHKKEQKDYWIIKFLLLGPGDVRHPHAHGHRQDYDVIDNGYAAADSNTSRRQG